MEINKEKKKEKERNKMHKIEVNGKLYIPKKFKEILGLKNGDSVEIYLRNDEEIVIRNINKHKEEQPKSKAYKYFKIPVEWSSAGIVRIKAKTLEDAVKKFDSIKDKIGSGNAEDIEMIYGTFDRIKDVGNPIQYYKDMQKFW